MKMPGVKMIELSRIFTLIPLINLFILDCKLRFLDLLCIVRQLNTMDKMTSVISINAANGFHINKRHVVITSGMINALDTVHSTFGFNIVHVQICMETRRKKAKVKMIMALLFVSNVHDLASMYEDEMIEKIKIIIPISNFLFINSPAHSISAL